MKLSTRARYGTRALLDLALQSRSEPVLLKDIAQRQEISLHYLEHLVGPLIAAGLIRSIRGARGGISLAKQPRDIKLSDIILILEGPVAPVECVTRPETCPRSEDCVTRDVWNDVKKAINGVLESVTLQDLVEKYQQGKSAEVTYYI